jgi:hypothetical protein
MALWSFTEQVAIERAAALASHGSFDEVLSLLRSARVIGFAWEPYRAAELRGTHRAEFLIQVSARGYDAFFNSPMGLRAQYALSPAQVKPQLDAS